MVWSGKSTHETSQPVSSFIPLQQSGKEGESAFHCISFAVLCSFLLESVHTALQVIFCHQGPVWTAAARSTSWLSRPGVYVCVCVLAPPWHCPVVRSGCTTLSKCFVSREGSWHAEFTEDTFAVLFWCTFVNYWGMYARENGVCHWRWHQGWPKGKTSILLYLTITEV